MVFIQDLYVRDRKEISLPQAEDFLIMLDCFAEIPSREGFTGILLCHDH